MSRRPKLKKCILTLTLCLSILSFGVSQENHRYDNNYRWLEEAKDLYELKLYGIAKAKIDAGLEAVNLLSHSASEPKIKEALLYQHLCPLHQQIDDSAADLQHFIDQYYPDPICNKAIYHLADYQYNNRKYKDALSLYALLDKGTLDPAQTTEVAFKEGYLHFANKQFNKAQEYLDLADKDKTYGDAARYYKGMSKYFEQDYKGAITDFESVSHVPEYRKQIPYYVSQIYFAQKEYDQLIDYATTKLEDPSLAQANQIDKLVGQAYFQQGNFEKALFHLESYEASTDKLSKEEFYQLGFTQYQAKKYEKAIKNFKAISNLDNKMGQLSNYYLADCYINTGDKTSARTAFNKVSRMSYDQSMQEEAMFNFAKLSAEEAYDSEAIKFLAGVHENSKYYDESQQILAAVLLRTKDYKSAINILEQREKLSPDLKTTYHKICFYQGLQHYNDRNYNMAAILMEKSLIYKSDPAITAQNYFWLGNIYQSDRAYNKSIKYYDSYFNSSAISALPLESSPAIAHYNQAYNHLKNGDYGKAQQHFQKSVTDLKKQNNNELKSKIYSDALVRTGDCYFKNSDYNNALSNYDQAINQKGKHMAYAYYQKGLIEGLSGDPYGKIISMEEVYKKYPESSYADEALLHLGNTYITLDNNQEAFTAFESIVKRYKTNSPLVNEAYLKLGLLSYNQGDTDNAIGYYKKVFTNNPDAEERLSALAALEEIYIRDLGKSDEYFQFVEGIPNYKISEFSKDSLSYKIAEIQFENKQYGKAATSFGEYLEKYPKGNYVLEAHYKKAESSFNKKAYASALIDYQYVVSTGINKYYEKSLHRAALISYNDSKNFSLAYEYYSSLLAYTSDESLKFESLQGAMESAYRSQKYPETMELASQMINHPSLGKSEESTALYYLGKSSLANDKIDQAIYAFNKLTKTHNNEYAAEGSYLVSKIFFDKDELDKAELQCKTTNTTGINYPIWVAKSLLLMTDIYIKKGDIYNARAACETVLNNFSEDPILSKEAKDRMMTIEAITKEKNRIKEETPGGILEFQKEDNND